MPSVQDILNQYTDTTKPGGPVTGSVPNPFQQDAAPPIAPPVPTKQDSVAQAADAKKATLAQTSDAKKAVLAQQNGLPSPDQMYSAVVARNTGAGTQTMPDQMSADAISMRPFELIQKYGLPTAERLMNNTASAQGSVSADLNYRRTDGQIAGDFASGVGLGVANSVGGVAALGAGIVNKGAGTAVASGIKALNDGVQENLQSPGLNAHRNLNAAKNALGYRDNEAQYQDTREKDGDFVAGLRRIAKDGVTAVGNAVTDPTVASDGLAQGIGSLLTAGPIGRTLAGGATLASRALLGGTFKEAALAGAMGEGSSVAAKMIASAAENPALLKAGQFIAHEGPTMAGIGATEAGGAYQQNAADVMGTKFEDLAKTSPMFNQLVAGGMSQEEARQTVANRSGLIAAAIQAPIATATGALVSKFESAPLKIPTLRQLGQNVLKEGVEETLQSGTGQAAQNIATSQTSDANKDLLDGIGEQAGLGGLYGMASAGMVSGPGSIMSAGTRGALGLGNKAVEIAGKRGDRIMAENEAKSPVSDQAISTAAAEAVQNTPAAAQAATDAINNHPDLSQEQKDAANSYVEAAKGVVHFHPDEVKGMPDVVQRAAAGQTSRIQFLQNLANEAKSDKNTDDDKAIALGTLSQSVGQLFGENGLNSKGDEFKSLPAEHEAKVFAEQVSELLNSFRQSPAGKTAESEERAAKTADRVSKEDLTVTHFTTPEGMKRVQANIAAAQISPQNANPANVKLILKAASAGKIQLDNQQSAALRVADSILDGQKQLVARLKQTGLSEKANLVSQRVAVNEGSPEGQESALEHLKAVRDAYGRGDFDRAGKALLGFQKFVQSQQNKILAVNAQVAAHGGNSNLNNALHYDAARQDKTGFTKSVNPFGVSLTGKRAVQSVGFVQQVAAEAHALTGIHNALATAFPELKVKHLAEVSLDSSLAHDTPQAVVKAFKDGTRGKNSNEPVKVEAASAPESSKPEAPVETPKQSVTSNDAQTKDAVKETAAPAESVNVSDKTEVAATEDLQPSSQVAEDQTSLEQEKEDLVNRKIDGVLTKAEEARLSEINRKLNPGEEAKQAAANYAAKKKYRMVGESDQQGPMADAFANLIHFPTGNKFVESFKFPKEPMTKLANNPKPLEAVVDALHSGSDFGRASGLSSDKFTPKVARDYQAFLRYVPKIIDAINAQIPVFLKKGNNQKDLDEGTKDIHRFDNGKLMNLVEEGEDGVLRINQQLAEGAALAGLQWLLEAREKSSHYDNDQIANIFNVDVDTVDANGPLALFLQQGTLRIDAFSDLAQKIQEYWGLAKNSEADVAYSMGIPQAMAAEIVKAMEGITLKNGEALTNPDWLHVDTKTGKPIKYVRRADGKLPKGVVEVEILRTQPKSAFGDVAKMADAIERVVALKPKQIYYFDGEMPVNSDEQMRNPGIKLTDEQKAMVDRESAVPHKLDFDAYRLFTALDAGGHLLNIFGPGEVDDKKLNVNDAISKKGQKLSITAARDAMKDIVAAMSAQAQAQNKSIEDVEVRYNYGVSKVGRLQMMGAFNPQASKLMRHVILPTESTLNMFRGDDIRAFHLGVAQGIGIKVHNMPYVQARNQMLDALNGKYAPAVDALRGFLKTGKLEPEDITKLSDSLGSGASFAQVYALKEYARLLNAEAAGEDLGAFKTKLYLEADGMTNGPIMAMAMFAHGPSDAQWVENMSKGGLYFGGTEFQNSTIQRQIDSEDLYKTTANKANVRLMDKLTDHTMPADQKEQLKHVLRLMNVLLGNKVIEFDGENVTMQRDLTKNPLTVTMYASGQTGIANKLVSMLTDAIYQQASKAIENGWSMNELFGPDAATKNDQLNTSLRALREFTPEYDRKAKKTVLVKTKNAMKEQSLKDFTLDGGDLKALAENVENYFVGDLHQAIVATVGGKTFEAMEMVKIATQAQSIMQEHMFQKLVNEAVEERKANDPTYRPGDFLSQKKLNEIQKSMRGYSPLIKAPGQTFFMSGGQRVGLAGKSFASSLSGSHSVPASVYGPGNIGVAGVASLNIGMGDGRAIQTFSNNPETDDRRLLIFDGIHLALDQIYKGSEQANQAIWQTWQGNPLKAVSQSFNTFMENIPATEIKEGSPLHLALVAAVFDPASASPKNIKAFPPEVVMDRLQQFQKDLHNKQLQVEAQHRAMNRVNVSVDQMAAAASPHRITTKEMVAGAPEQVAQRLSELTAEERDKMGAKKEELPVTESIPTELAKWGEALPSGARSLTMQGVRRVIEGVLKKIPLEQARVLKSIHQMMEDEGYSLIHGTREQLLAHNASLGSTMIDASLLTEEGNHGFTLTGRKEIWMVSPSSETLAHELVHAATVKKVQSFYAGENVGPHVTQAIQNLEVLMQQFLNLEKLDDSEGGIGAMPREMQVAYRNAVAAINGALSNDKLSPQNRQAVALNEYMAWGLANTQLANLQTKVKAYWLVQMAKSVIEAIRTIVMGKNAPMAPKGDMFSNLLFNTQVVMASQPTISQQMADTVLFQNTQYGNNDRLTDLDQTFDTLVTKWIGEADRAGDTKETVRRQFEAQKTAQLRGIQMADAFATVFPEMTVQEKTTFQKIVAALTTEARFDPASLARMHQLYSQVIKQLDATMMEDPNEPDENQRRSDAQDKVDAIRGVMFKQYDTAGRSTLLPTFVALAMTNEHFRSVLAKMDLPKSEGSKAESRVDRALEDLGNNVLDSLGRRISGEGKSSDVLAAMDAMADRFADIAQERQTALDKFLSDSGGLVDSSNDYMVRGMQALSRFLVRKTGEWDQAYDNKLSNLVAQSTRLFTAIVSEEQAEHVAEGLLSQANKIKAFKPFTDLIHDMIGRVASNAQVYDMIKTVRSMIQKMRQQFREEVPKTIAAQFSRDLSEQEWDLLHAGMGKTDLASLVQGMSQDEALSMITNDKARAAKIKELEAELRAADKPHFDFRQRKMKELARYMMTGETSSNLLRNATAIARMAGTPDWLVPKNAAALVKNIDMLTSLYAMNEMGSVEQAKLSALTKEQEKGIKFALSYLQGQRKDEMAKAESNDRAVLNHFKGYIPQVQQAGTSLIVADDSDFAELAKRSYVRIGDYAGSRAETGRTKKGYYFMPANGRQAFQQGILQNVRQTAGGVDVASGYSQMQNAGRITKYADVKRIESMIAAQAEKNDTEHLMPVFDEKGEVVAYERPMNQSIMNSKLKFNTRLHEMLGVWRGRQVEESLAADYNNQLIDKLADMHDEDMKKSKGNTSRYIDVFDPREQAKDPVLKDAVALITPAMRQQIQQRFGNQFFVRRDMLNDALGYRSASVGDAWTGNSRWSEDTQKQFQRMAMSVFGNKAYQYMVNAERTFQNFVGDVKTMIVVKSVVVPISNLLANGYQLASRGVPIKHIITGMPKKTAEVKMYVQSELRRIEADAELRAAEGQGKTKLAETLRAEIEAINDSHTRLSIWPLIQAGEFSAVSDGQATAEEVELTSGRLHSYMEGLVDKLPPGFKTAGRYALITKDTALFQGMQTAVEYGDFLAKAILYDDLTRRQGKSKEYALGRVTEEFVNYDRLPGRFRGYMESMGLMWFYNFKIRSAKIALSMIRNNPVHALLAGMTPSPSFLGSVGTPITDNIFAKLASGQLSFGLGVGQIFHAPQLNPWVNIFNH